MQKRHLTTSPAPPSVPRPLLDADDLHFVEEYLVDMDPERACRRLGWDDWSRRSRSLMRRSEIRGAIEACKRQRAGRLELPIDYVLRRWVQVAEADPRELVEHWRVPCRYCWGVDHLYQFTDVELREAGQRHRMGQLKVRDERRRVEFDELGGGGYTVNKEPMRGADWVEFMGRNAEEQGLPSRGSWRSNNDHSCPQCFGHGESHPFYHDTRWISPQAAMLFAGLKVSRGGFEMVLRDRAPVELLIAKHMGAFEVRQPAGAASERVSEVRSIIIDNREPDEPDDAGGGPPGGSEAPPPDDEGLQVVVEEVPV